MRLDLYLFNNEQVKSRQKAKDLIEQGCVLVNGQVITKPAYEIDENSNNLINIYDNCKYVSRGGLKLEKIINESCIDISDKVCLDIGASTGGFTDCLLQFGAKKVFSVDSGTNQLDKSLKENPKVISIEGFNARNISFDLTCEYVDIITIDVSFISQTLIMPSAFSVLKENGAYISLIKPQFEAGREKIGKGGIVKNGKDRFFAVKKVIDFAKESGFNCTHFTKSPIKGGDGNVEFLGIFEKSDKYLNEENIKTIVLSQWGYIWNLKDKKKY